jgi:hypothetical protein
MNQGESYVSKANDTDHGLFLSDARLETLEGTRIRHSVLSSGRKEVKITPQVYLVVGSLSTLPGRLIQVCCVENLKGNGN